MSRACSGSFKDGLKNVTVDTVQQRNQPRTHGPAGNSDAGQVIVPGIVAEFVAGFAVDFTAGLAAEFAAVFWGEKSKL